MATTKGTETPDGAKTGPLTSSEARLPTDNDTPFNIFTSQLKVSQCATSEPWSYELDSNKKRNSNETPRQISNWFTTRGSPNP
jgi:hypothetical protein